MIKKKVVVLLFILIAVAACCGSFFIGYSVHDASDKKLPIQIYNSNFDARKEVYVIGHKNPDLDAVCSAIGVAELLNKIGIKAVPAVCDTIPLNVEYFLSQNNKECPVLLTDATGKQIVMVDYNNFDQGVDNMENANLLGVIDHHNIGGIETDNPLFTTIKPMGSTASIVCLLYDYYDKNIEKGTANLLLTALIDDTKNLSSSTTTDKDIRISDRLKEITGITDTDALYSTICNLETNHDGMTDKEILDSDSKPYTMEGYTVTISDIKVKGKEDMEKMIQRLNDALKKIYPKQEADHLYVIVSDLENDVSELLYYGTGSERVVSEAFPVDSSGRIYFDHVASRKMDIVPVLKKAYRIVKDSLS